MRCALAGAVLSAVFLAAAGHVCAEELSGEVVGIIDGDTLIVLVDERQLRVRLAEIDAPEKGQAFGKKARQHLGDLCIRRPAQVTSQVRDAYGRIVARVQCDGTDVSEAQVRAGFAWVFTKYAPLDSPLYVLEAQARAARRGLWAGSRPQAPWDWRAPLTARRDAQADAVCCGPGIRRQDGSCATAADIVVDLLLAPKAELISDEGCGSRGGPGFRLPNGKCASWGDF
jgi:endonuclease YncB( thermonuclease family)